MRGHLRELHRSWRQLTHHSCVAQPAYCISPVCAQCDVSRASGVSPCDTKASMMKTQHRLALHRSIQEGTPYESLPQALRKVVPYADWQEQCAPVLYATLKSICSLAVLWQAQARHQLGKHIRRTQRSRGSWLKLHCCVYQQSGFSCKTCARPTFACGTTSSRQPDSKACEACLDAELLRAVQCQGSVHSQELGLVRPGMHGMPRV